MNRGKTENTKRYALGLSMQVTIPCRKAIQGDRTETLPEVLRVTELLTSVTSIHAIYAAPANNMNVNSDGASFINTATLTVPRRVWTRPSGHDARSRRKSCTASSVRELVSTNSMSMPGTMMMPTSRRQQTHGFQDMAAWHGYGFDLTGEHAEWPEVVEAARDSSNLLSVLGVQPALGRTFTAEEDRPEANHVVMLSWSPFRRR